MYALDTNVLVRYVVEDGDSPEQTERAAALMGRFTPDNPAFVSCVVLCELVWVLKSAYQCDKAERINALHRILSMNALDVENLEACQAAFQNYRFGQADFSDYLIQEIAASNGYPTVITFDRKAQKSMGFVSPETVTVT